MPRNADGGPTRIGPWRLLDLVRATTPLRASMLGGGGALPEYGPPDAPGTQVDPAELPESNISDGEQQQAMQRERARRFVRTRRPSQGG